MAMSDGFCVVGSDDGFLRVWPLDFADYLLEVALHPRMPDDQTTSRL